MVRLLFGFDNLNPRFRNTFARDLLYGVKILVVAVFHGSFIPNLEGFVFNRCVINNNRFVIV